MSIMRARALILLAACGGDGGDTSRVMAARFTLTEMSGAGPSPIDPVVGQPIDIEVSLVEPMTYSETVDTCRWTTDVVELPPRIARDATAALVQSEILDILPHWEARLALCDIASQSSVRLHSDNDMGLALTIGCITVPASAQLRDGAGNPMWSAFSASGCEAQVYDQAHGRLFTGRDFSLVVR
jgi:hypothetical protein